MKVNYDAKTDTLTVLLREVPVAESDEEKPGVILDYDRARPPPANCLLYLFIH